MKSSEMVLAVRGVRVGYGAEDRLHGVELEVPAGSFLAIVGPNGSGKSTLLRTMARAVKPRVGAVLLDGRDVMRWNPRQFARKLAVVSQEGSPAFDYTAYEVVEMGRTPYEGLLTPDPGARRAVEMAMREVGVWRLRGRKLGQLSGGERQLVALARALAQEPEVLLLDEPTNHLDIRHQVAFMEVLLRLNERDVTVLMVAHDLNLAARYARKVVVLCNGKISAGGPPSVALRPEVIRKVFGADMEVSISTQSGALQIYPPVLPPPDLAETPKVHVVCGGGSGAHLMRRLHEEDIAFSVGVVNVGDTDHAVARSLGASLVDEASYSPISDEAHERNVAAAKTAGLVVVCDMPVGPGNLRNLEAVAEAQETGVPVALLRAGLPPCVEEKDYTGGEATRLLEALSRCGARSAESVDKIVGLLDDALSVSDPSAENE
jgi:iron complex transport system ATP-binding protein